MDKIDNNHRPTQPGCSANTVVFDVDEVVANIRDKIASVLHKVTGRDISPERWDTYDLSEIYGIDIDRCLAAFLEHEVLENATLEPGAREAIKMTRESGYRVMMLTARGWHPDGDRLTREWLSAHGIIVDELRLIPVHASKVTTLEGTNTLFFVDDNPRHIIEAEGSTSILTPVLFTRPWNRSVEVRNRIDTLKEFESMVRQREKMGKAPLNITIGPDYE